MRYVEGTDGREYIVDSSNLVVARRRPEWDYQEGPTCSICDGLGHGYPGGMPCPIEDRDAWR